MWDDFDVALVSAVLHRYTLFAKISLLFCFVVHDSWSTKSRCACASNYIYAGNSRVWTVVPWRKGMVFPICGCCCVCLYNRVCIKHGFHWLGIYSKVFWIWKTWRTLFHSGNAPRFVEIVYCINAWAAAVIGEVVSFFGAFLPLEPLTIVVWDQWRFAWYYWGVDFVDVFAIRGAFVSE